MNAIKNAQIHIQKSFIQYQDYAGDYKVGDTVKFLDQWRNGIYIFGVVMGVGPRYPDGWLLKVKPVTEKGERREFHINSMFTEKVGSA